MKPLDVLQPEGHWQAWLDADNPVAAILTWDRITLTCYGTSGRNHEVIRRTRAGKINARKRAIERFPWKDAHGNTVRVQLTLTGKDYSETWGFLHASYFTYSVKREIVSTS